MRFGGWKHYRKLEIGWLLSKFIFGLFRFSSLVLLDHVKLARILSEMLG